MNHHCFWWKLSIISKTMTNFIETHSKSQFLRKLWKFPGKTGKHYKILRLCYEIVVIVWWPRTQSSRKLVKQVQTKPVLLFRFLRNFENLYKFHNHGQLTSFSEGFTVDFFAVFQTISQKFTWFQKNKFYFVKVTWDNYICIVSLSLSYFCVKLVETKRRQPNELKERRRTGSELNKSTASKYFVER